MIPGKFSCDVLKQSHSVWMRSNNEHSKIPPVGWEVGQFSSGGSYLLAWREVNSGCREPGPLFL